MNTVSARTFYFCPCTSVCVCRPTLSTVTAGFKTEDATDHLRLVLLYCEVSDVLSGPQHIHKDSRNQRWPTWAVCTLILDSKWTNPLITPEQPPCRSRFRTGWPCVLRTQTNRQPYFGVSPLAPRSQSQPSDNTERSLSSDAASRDESPRWHHVSLFRVLWRVDGQCRPLASAPGKTHELKQWFDNVEGETSRINEYSGQIYYFTCPETSLNSSAQHSKFMLCSSSGAMFMYDDIITQCISTEWLLNKCCAVFFKSHICLFDDGAVTAADMRTRLKWRHVEPSLVESSHTHPGSDLSSDLPCWCWLQRALQSWRAPLKGARDNVHHRGDGRRAHRLTFLITAMSMCFFRRYILQKSVCEWQVHSDIHRAAHRLVIQHPQSEVLDNASIFFLLPVVTEMYR